MIQIQILQRLGFNKQPNVSHDLTEEDRRSWGTVYQKLRQNTRDDDIKEIYSEDDYFAKKYHWHLPSCKSDIVY